MKKESGNVKLMYDDEKISIEKNNTARKAMVGSTVLKAQTKTYSTLQHPTGGPPRWRRMTAGSALVEHRVTFSANFFSNSVMDTFMK